MDISPLIPYFNSWDWKKIIQRAKFESQFLEFFHGANINNVWDTELAEKIANPSAFTASLEVLAERYLDIKLNKDIRKSFFKGTVNKNGDYSHKQLEYAAQDVEILPAIMEKQRTLIEERDQLEVAELEFQLAKVVGHMELTGIPVNAGKWRLILEEYRQLHEEARIRMNDLIFDTNKFDEQMGMFVRDGIKLGSPQKILHTFNALGIPITDTTDRTISLINHPLARALTEFRGLDKLMSSYGKTFLDAIHPFTGRIHANFQQMGADTGRFSCREPNMQQIPEKFRVCVGDTKDFLIVGADYSQMELRIIAELSEDERMVAAFASGQDVHKATASLMFNVALDHVTKEQRFAAKTINFGIAYGMGIKKLMDSINGENMKNGIKKKIGYKDAQYLKERHRQAYPRVKEWLDENGNLAYQKGESLTMLGRKRSFNKPNRNEMTQDDFDDQVASIKRRGANTPIQGTNADITKLAMINLHEDLMRYNMGADIINQVHDEIVLLAHYRQAEDVRKLVEESMVSSAQRFLKKVPVVVDTYASDVWSK